MTKPEGPGTMLLDSLLQIFCLLNLFLTSSAFHITLTPPELDISVEIGVPFSITCEAFGCPNPAFLWARLMDKTLSGTINSEGQRSILSIPSVSEESEGPYVCKVYCNGQKMEKKIQINIYSFPNDPVLEVSSLVAGVESSVHCLFPLIHPWEMLEAFILLGGEQVTEDSDVIQPTINSHPQNISVIYTWTPTESDEGKEVECKGVMSFLEEDSIPMTRSTKMALRLNYAPNIPIITPLPSNVVREGEQISITCTEESRSPTTITWVKMDGDKEIPISSEERGTLRIQGVDLQDAGTYICYAKNKVGEKSAQVEITVQGLPGDPELSILPDSTVTMGEKVTIHCAAQGSHTLVTLWKVSESGDVLLQDNEGTLYIEKAEPQHAGVYKCKTKNPFGEREVEGSLRVEYGPTNTVISSSPVTVVEGGSVTLTCVSDGIPPPKFSLYSISTLGESLLLSNESEVILGDLQSTASRMYKCTAHNKLGTNTDSMELQVQVPPKNTHVFITPPGVVKEGELVNISCVSEGSPEPEVVLKKKTNFGLVDLGVEGGEHIIFHAHIGHTGTYVCESTNMLGQEFAEATLTVQVPPKNTTVLVLPSENVTEGDTVIISCETHSIPSPTFLLKKVCGGNNTVLQAKNGTFTLHNVTLNDTGTYMLSISNEAGNETEVIEILVKERQVNPQYRFTAPVILVSMAAVSAGVIGVIIYNLKQAKMKGSYNLVKALRGIV
ncbi:vascular cell adhesion protein 1-like [Discoglossus pictus]